jgi:WhiB family redox-sensing transcriptional regulator
MPPRLVDLVDATTTRQQIGDMQATGMTIVDIADLAGIGRSSIYAIARHQQRHCTHRIADAIAALHAETIAANDVARTLFKRIVTAKPDWYDAAECKGLDPDMFYPERGVSTDEAKQVCAMCPVQVQCAEHAIVTMEKNGIWGGLSERQRKTIRAAS